MSSKESAPCVMQIKETKMKNTTLADLPKHRCARPANPRLGFAPLDSDVMQQLVDRNASKEEMSFEINARIAADAAKDPKPTESEENRFREAIFSNNPFAVYCAQCLELLCLIHPEEMKEGGVANEQGESQRSAESKNSDPDEIF